MLTKVVSKLGLAYVSLFRVFDLTNSVKFSINTIRSCTFED